MSYTTTIIQNPPSDVLDFINERTLEQLNKFRQCSEHRQYLMSVFGEDVIKDVDLKSFVTALGLLGLANKAGSFQKSPRTGKDALVFLPGELDVESYSTGWLIGMGVHLALDIHNGDADCLAEVLKLIHRHNAIGNCSMDIDHLHSAINDSRVDVQEITYDLANKISLDLFTDIAKRANRKYDNSCLTTDDIDRINQCDLAILAIMRHNLTAYDINIYGGKDVLASFMGVYDLFVKYQDKDVVESVRQAIAGVKNQPIEEKEHIMQTTRPTLNSANTLSTAKLSNKALSNKILSYAKENILADFVKLIEWNVDIYGEPNLSELVNVEVDNTDNVHTIHLTGENYSFVVHFSEADYYDEKEYPSKAVLYIGNEVSELDLQNIEQYKNLGMDVNWNNGSYLFSDFTKQLDSLISFFKLSK